MDGSHAMLGTFKYEEIPARSIESRLFESERLKLRNHEDLLISADFIRQCLTIDPKDRPPASALLKHAWLSGI